MDQSTTHAAHKHEKDAANRHDAKRHQGTKLKLLLSLLLYKGGTLAQLNAGKPERRGEGPTALDLEEQRHRRGENKRDGEREVLQCIIIGGLLCAFLPKASGSPV